MKLFIGKHFGLSEKFSLRKISCIGCGGILVLSNFFVSQDRNEKLCKRTRRFSESFLVSKKFMIKRGISRISIENSLSHSFEKLRRGNLLCSRKILLSKNDRDKRGGVYQIFPSIFFCLTVPNFSYGNPLVFH